MEPQKNINGKSFETIIKENYNYLISLASKFLPQLKTIYPTITINDIINDGVIGMHKALKTYDEKIGSLLTHCRHYIQYEMYFKHIKNNKLEYKKKYYGFIHNYATEKKEEENDIESRLERENQLNVFKLENIKQFINRREFDIIKGIYFDKKDLKQLSKELNLHRKNIWKNKQIALNKLKNNIIF